MTRTMFAVALSLAISLGMAAFALTTLPARAEVLVFGDVNLDPPDLNVGGGVGNPVGTLVVRGGSKIAGNGLFIGGVTSAVGTLVVDGMGSVVTVNGFFLPDFDATNGIDVGGEGHGSLVIQNGGAVVVGDGTTFINNFIANAAGSTGTVTVKGAESRFDSSGLIGVGNGNVITIAGGFGFDFGIPGAVSTGTLDVLEGGGVTVNRLSLGGSENASGTVNVNGAGSTIRNDPTFGPMFVIVGGDGHGIMNITNGGAVTGVLFLNVGRGADSGGVVNVAGNGSLLRLEGCGDVEDGTFLTVGRNGSGALNIVDGGKLVFDSSGVVTPCFFAGFNVARNPESTGDIRVIGVGSELRVIGDSGFAGIGRRGTGSLTVSIGALVIIEDSVDGSIFIAPANRSVGTIRILGERKDNSGNVIEPPIPTELNAGGTLALGLGFDEVTDAGVATLIVDSGGTATAGAIKIGALGTVFLNGTLNGTVTNGGTINPGFSPGTGTITNDYNQTDAGKLNIEIERDAFDRLLVGGAANLAGVINLLIADDVGNVDANIIVAGSLILDDNLLVSINGSVPLPISEVSGVSVKGGVMTVSVRGGKVKTKRKTKTKTK